MASRCQYCADLSIYLLFAIIIRFLNFEWSNMPRNAFYPHHKSMDDLESSADRGCDFCALLLKCFKTTPAYRFSSATWLGEPSQFDHDDRGSIFTVLKELPSMSLDICMHPRHITSFETWKNARVFDQIVVQPRGVPTTAYMNELTGQFDCIPVILTITSPMPLRVGDFQIGRKYTDPDLGSQSNFDIVRDWLRTCQTQHVTCPKHDIAELPSRIIDVGISEEPNILRIVHSHGELGQYAMLSHCWGGRISHVLIEETFEEFQQCLPFEDLPANFRDAIIITRQLGMRYLWIDSLCILQDSKSDWEKESKKMGDYYRYSALTISALSSENSTRGMLKTGHRNTKINPIELGLLPDSDKESQVIVERLAHEREDLYLLNTEGPLASRAWAFQEELLPPRHLYYGNHQIYWKCPSGERSLEDVPSRAGFPLVDFDLIRSIIHEGLYEMQKYPIIHTEKLLLEYYTLIQMYSGRKLTYDSDKLVAFSGLAQCLAPAIGGKYLAGLWSFDISSGLNWSSAGDFRPVRTYRAPSWSWASLNEQIHFGNKIFDSNESKLQLLGHSLSYRDPSNEFGEVTGGHILVQGCTKPLVRSTQVDSKAEIHELFSCRMSIGNHGLKTPYEISFVSKEDGGYFLITPRGLSAVERPDDMEIDADFPDKYFILLLGNISSVSPSARCLILREVACGEEKQFERVGYLLYYSGHFPRVDEWEKKVLKLI
ncbi:HET-domain-containing protein [Annulohypoxylon moriforme]|nr:HET-domain-containing protein [Annulohypoxylon moriforme]